jgi:DNA-directed RNA polymerase subunit RPC12/RpoP
MPSDHDDNLLRQAIINIKAGDFSLARRYLELALEMADDRETRTQANYWMSQICSDPLEKRRYLEETIANDPVHPEARRALAVLDGKLKPGEIVNPDALPAQVTGSQVVTAERFTCPKCGGRMVFDGDGRTLVCEYCARNQVLSSAAPQFEQDFITTMATGQGHRTPVTQKTFNCQGCGAHFILPAQQISAVCAYCGSAHVLTMTRELVEPDSIIPMAFSQQQASMLMLTWLQKHKLQPGARLPEPRGVFLPVWTFDMFGFVPWKGTVYRNKQQVPVSGEQNVSLNDIVIPGVRRLPGLLPKMLADFDTSSAPAYDSRYLSGWPAEVYELAMSDASLEARKQAVERVRAKIQAEKGHVSDLQYSSANLSILSFKLVLVPLWNSAYSFEGRDFQVVINGQIGKVYAETHKQGILSWLEDVFGE